MLIIVQIVVILTGVLMLVDLFQHMVRRQLVERSAFMWMLVSVVLIIFGIFPNMIIPIAKWLGVEYPPALLFTIAIAFLLFIVFRCAKDLAYVTIELQEAAMHISLLNEEVMSLTARVKALEERLPAPEAEVDAPDA